MLKPTFTCARFPPKNEHPGLKTVQTASYLMCLNVETHLNFKLGTKLFVETKFKSFTLTQQRAKSVNISISILFFKEYK